MDAISTIETHTFLLVVSGSGIDESLIIIFSVSLNQNIMFHSLIKMLLLFLIFKSLFQMEVFLKNRHVAKEKYLNHGYH